MASLSDMIGYFCEHYPHKSELSKARLTKMVYLADWKSAIETEDQISNINWKFNHYGPYVDDIVNTARSDAAFDVSNDINAYGDMKETIRLVEKRSWKTLSDTDRRWMDHVIEETKSLYWKDFIKLVYSTFPVLVSDKLSLLDLPRLAKRYKKDVQQRV